MKYRGYIRTLLGMWIISMSAHPADVSMILGILIGIWGVRDLVFKVIIPYIHKRGWGIHHDHDL